MSARRVVVELTSAQIDALVGACSYIDTGEQDGGLTSQQTGARRARDNAIEAMLTARSVQIEGGPDDVPHAVAQRELAEAVRRIRDLIAVADPAAPAKCVTSSVRRILGSYGISVPPLDVDEPR